MHFVRRNEDEMMDRGLALAQLVEMMELGLGELDGEHEHVERYLTAQGIDWVGVSPDELVDELLDRG